ncbi:MAG: transporter permease [Actinomycetota bacterium]|jgi:ABC-2 type transport system permease protein|nr:transporter permease [Actinomycetota bacterium]
MRWLLLKDLQILRRSPLQLALLVLYPIVIALLVGFAMTRGGEETKVALFNAMPAGSSLGFGGEEVNGDEIRDQLCDRVDCLEADSTEDASGMVESGEATAAVIVPEDLGEKILSLASLNPQSPEIQVIVNGSNTVESEVTDDRIEAMLAEANLLLAERLSESASDYLELILKGGDFTLFGQDVEVLGLQRSEQILKKLEPRIPDRADREELQRAIRFAGLATDNLDLAGPLLTAITQPIKAEKVEVGDEAPSLDTFAIGVTTIFALMFVTVLLVAGSLALEKEENAFTRLTAGLVSRWQILVAKIGLGTVIGSLVALILLVGLGLFVGIEWGRAPLWLLAVVFGAAAFSAGGAALGASAREVRAATLAAVMVCLPVALLSLVPDDTVGPVIETAINLVSAIFPFRPALDAITGGLELSGPGIWLPLLHLAILTAAYSVLARLALRRF